MSMSQPAYVVVTRPYLAMVSVNRAYRRGNPRSGIDDEVVFWLNQLKATLRDKIAQKGLGLPTPGTPVELDIRILRKPAGRPPDVSNFRKLPQDAIAAELGVDDNVFYGTDYPLEKSPTNHLIFNIGWSYEKKGEAMGYDNSVLYTGPMTATSAKLFSITKKDYCTGFSSVFCLGCTDCPTDCPADFSPTVYTEVPCKACTRQGCPCKGADSGYEERKARITLWWQARQASTSFEKLNWPKGL